MSRDPSKLHVFKLAHELALSVYRVTARLPADERFGLTTQLRRAVVSIPTNIAEGCGRSTAREYHRFLDVAAGSACEVRYLLHLVADLGLLSGTEFEECRISSEHLARALLNLQSAVERFEDRAAR